MNQIVIDIKYPRQDAKDPDKTRWDPAGVLIVQSESAIPTDLRIFGQSYGHGDIMAFIRQSNAEGGASAPAPF